MASAIKPTKIAAQNTNLNVLMASPIKPVRKIKRMVIAAVIRITLANFITTPLNKSSSVQGTTRLAQRFRESICWNLCEVMASAVGVRYNRATLFNDTIVPATQEILYDPLREML